MLLVCAKNVLDLYWPFVYVEGWSCIGRHFVGIVHISVSVCMAVRASVLLEPVLFQFWKYFHQKQFTLQGGSHTPPASAIVIW